MKIQIRRHVFETNSSTNHTLSITKCLYDKNEIVGKLCSILDSNFLCVGKTPVKNIKQYADFNLIELHMLDLQIKLDILFYSALNYYDVRGFVHNLNNLSKLFESYGFNVKYNFEHLVDAADEYLDYGIFEFVSSNISSEEELLSFLFSTKAYYTSWCDEGCMGPSSDIEEIENDMYGKDDVLYIHDRY